MKDEAGNWLFIFVTLPRVYARAAPATPAPTITTSVSPPSFTVEPLLAAELLMNWSFPHLPLETLTFLIFLGKLYSNTNPNKEAMKPPRIYRSIITIIDWIIPEVTVITIRRALFTRNVFQFCNWQRQPNVYIYRRKRKQINGPARPGFEENVF